MNHEFENEKPAGTATFAGLAWAEALAAARRAGFKEPTEIQEKFIPAALTGRDCVGRARTGTGKTAAFLLPVLHRFYEGEPVRMIVLAPTRELAEQIKEESWKLTGEKTPPGAGRLRGEPHQLPDRSSQA